MPTTFLNFGPELDKVFRDAEAILKAQGSEAATEAKILVGVSATAGLVQQVLDLLNSGIGRPSPPAAAESDFGPPIYRKGVRVMNFDLKNDWVVGPVAIVAKDDEGNVVPMPDGAVFTSSVSDPSALNVVDNDGTHWSLNALKRRGTVTVTHHEAASMMPDFTDTINIVEDLMPAAVDSDFSNATHTMQPLPAA